MRAVKTDTFLIIVIVVVVIFIIGSILFVIYHKMVQRDLNSGENEIRVNELVN